MCSKTVDSLRWHDEERSKDGKLRHPADGQAWNDFDRFHPDFALDSRNMCMKSEYSILSLLIPGPRSPGNDIDIYLQPLIDEFKLLWDSGVEMYDTSRNQTFQMRAALMWAVNDFPAYAMFSGWSTKGKAPPPLLKGPYVLNSLPDFENVFGKKRNRSNDGPWKKSKTKDHAKAWYDLKEVGIRKNLHPKDTGDNKRTKFAKACFSMKNGEKSVFCGVLKTAKLPDRSASNICRCVKLDERKLSGYKTHDAHFMLHYLLPIPIKSFLPDHVAIALIHLCSFFQRLCQKVITLEELDFIEVEIKETINQLERIFPPSFFYIMIHFPIHLANEVRLGGPVQNRWMYSTEREMGTFKSYICNRCYPEGCIAEARVGIYCMNLFSRYWHGAVQTKFNRRARNNDECDPSDAETYMLCKEHEKEVNNQSRRSKWSKAKNHCQNFSQWFETRSLQEDVPNLIKQLSRGPNSIAKRYSGYLINGYRFHIRQRDARRKTQNSGVTLFASTTSFASSKDKNPTAADLTYYGRIVDIVELDYYSNFKEDPFVLASQVHQCLYVQDPFDQERHYVMKTVLRDFFNMSDEFESDLPQSYENELSEHLIGTSIPEDDGDVPLVRTDVPKTVINVPLEEFVTQQLEVKYEKDFEDEFEDEY
ncbi:uncharacterized protein LOC125836844 [Solanum verrucosum]|uniref:uncharacterized protein LOC125836844 n=1 Tax=Solanum verrucosum TaxID=315347 RepID=UPI0020D0FD17|nr:uncharacterized protein LOC125836844 [Solanum verrucosum]